MLKKKIEEKGVALNENDCDDVTPFLPLFPHWLRVILRVLFSEYSGNNKVQPHER